MQAWATSGRWLLFGTALALGTVTLPRLADASTMHRHPVSRARQSLSHFSRALWRNSNVMHPALRDAVYRTPRARRWNGGLQCVPYAREVSGIEIRGNAANWWEAADGVYARGNTPEPGSVLNFRANGHMRLGHVAVVTDVINSREIVIEHANWGPGRISRNVSVIDVSPDNDWTAVRVALAHGGDYGSVYPTYGFIYDRPAATETAAATLPGVALSPATLATASGPIPYSEVADMVPAPVGAGRGWHHARWHGRPQRAYEEVAEAPVRRRGRGLDLNVGAFRGDLDLR